MRAVQRQSGPPLARTTRWAESTLRAGAERQAPLGLGAVSEKTGKNKGAEPSRARTEAMLLLECLELSSGGERGDCAGAAAGGGSELCGGSRDRVRVLWCKWLGPCCHRHGLCARSDNTGFGAWLPTSLPGTPSTRRGSQHHNPRSRPPRDAAQAIAGGPRRTPEDSNSSQDSLQARPRSELLTAPRGLCLPRLWQLARLSSGPAPDSSRAAWSARGLCQACQCAGYFSCMVPLR